RGANRRAALIDGEQGDLVLEIASHRLTADLELVELGGGLGARRRRRCRCAGAGIAGDGVGRGWRVGGARLRAAGAADGLDARLDASGEGARIEASAPPADALLGQADEVLAARLEPERGLVEVDGHVVGLKEVLPELAVVVGLHDALVAHGRELDARALDLPSLELGGDGDGVGLFGEAELVAEVPGPG